MLVAGQENQQVEAWVDLAHEALMEGWQKFAQWRQENRELRRLVDRAEDALQQWQKEQKDENLMMGGLLVQAKEKWRELKLELDPITRDFYQKSVEFEQEQFWIFIRQKQQSVVTLSTGLANELNNPASAIVRTLREMPSAILELQRMNLVYGQRNVEEAHTQNWLRVRDQGYDAILNNRLDPVTLSDRETALLEWLEDYGVKQAWKLAEPLAEGGIEVETLDHLMERWRNDNTELREMGLHWLSLSFEVMSMIKHGLRGAERISELVQAMKSYAYLDQGVQQEVNVHQGLEDTLRLFVHKLKCGIQVQRNYDQHLPKILAYGSELNQVWTNLIDNAIDAMEGSGVLEITTQHCDRFAHIEIIDSGSGIPPEIQTRIFEPFFTTKSVGHGSGREQRDLVR